MIEDVEQEGFARRYVGGREAFDFR